MTSLIVVVFSLFATITLPKFGHSASDTAMTTTLASILQSPPLRQSQQQCQCQASPSPSVTHHPNEFIRTSANDTLTLTAGVFLLSKAGTYYDLEKAYPALEMAVEKVNRDILPGVGANLTLILTSAGNECTSNDVSGKAALLIERGDLVALLGPTCSLALDHVARLSGYLNVTTITAGGEAGSFEDVNAFPTLVRFGYSYSYTLLAMVTFLNRYNYTHVSLFYDISDTFLRTAGANYESALKAKTFIGIELNVTLTGVYTFASKNGTADYANLLQQANEKSRVAIVCAGGDAVRSLMLTAHSLGLTHGENVYMDTELFKSYVFGNKHWRRNDKDDEAARQAYRSLIRLALPNITDSDRFEQFDRDVKDRAKRIFGDGIFLPDEMVAPSVAAFHDAVLVFASAIKLALTNGMDISNGRNIINYFTNQYFNDSNLLTGSFLINERNDRQNDFTFNDLDQVTGEFQPVALYNALEESIYWNGRNIDWNNLRNSPPLDEPFCGYRNENPACASKSERTAIYVVSSVFALLFIVSGAAFWFYRQWQERKMLKNLHWLIHWSELVPFNEDGKRSRSEHSLKSRISESNKSSTGSRGSAFNLMVEAAKYEGAIVAIKRRRIKAKSHDRAFLLEMCKLKNLQHENLVRTIGACMEIPNQCLVVEYCQRGSLEDLLETTSNTVTWDLQFKLSLLHDTAQGLSFLHKSPFEMHGRLTPSNCLVDSRFVVKLTDWHTVHFPPFANEMENKANEKLLYAAPEVLRFVVPRSPQADIYAYGMIAIEIMTLNSVYGTERQSMEIKKILERVRGRKTYRPGVISDIQPAAVQDLITKCALEDPFQRPSCAAILAQLKKANNGRPLNVMQMLLTRLQKHNEKLETTVHERDEQLIEEQHKVKRFLTELLPKSVANQLIAGGNVAPETYESVTIFVSDVVGFVSLNSESSPVDIVNFLNSLYTCLDDSMQKYEVCKIQTIPSTSMYVSGLPEKNGTDHAFLIARAAMAALAAVGTLPIRHRPGRRVQIRIGIHSGPCAAGVVGLKIPRYCIFGDTVMVAALMETSSEAGKIQVSEATKTILEQLSENFLFKQRGDVGKDTMIRSYWLNGEIKRNAV